MEPSGASMQSRVWGIERALGWLATPAIRMMDRMRFGRRMALLGAMGMLATVVTLVFFVPMLGRDVAFVRSERAGVQAVPALVDLVAQMQRHRGNVNRLLKGDATAKPAVDKAAAEAGAASAQLDAVFADAARGLDLGAQWQALREGWSALARDSEALTPAESFTRHSERIHQALDLLEAVSRRSGLMLDPQLSSWALADSATRRLPAYMELIGVMRGTGAGALAAGDTSSATREAVRTTRGIAEYVYDDKRAAFDETLKAAPEMAAIVAQAEQLGSLHAGYMATTQAQFAGTEPPSISAADYFAQGTALVDGAHAIVQAAVPQLQQLLEQRQSALERKRAIVLAICVLSILLESYCFLGFARSLTGTLRRLSQASRLLADGRFPEPIRLYSGDELQTIADETARVSATLQRFDAAQRALATCHAQGDTDARIDTAEFRGAYGEMAAALNAALEGHIQVQQRMTEVVARYARGDLSVRIEDMPGRRAEISSAINQVRDRLEQVNRQILALAEAAAHGEFSVRGELDGLEFAYAEMVQGLNRLMRNAETGLGDLDRFMSALAAGDLRVRMQGDYAGMFAHLRDSAHQTAAQLSDLVGRIHGSADAIGLAAAEIGQGNAELSSRTERQAAALEETASSAATSSTAVHRTTAEAQRASTLASEARRCAESGGEVMLRTVATMRRLQDSSSKIHEIIGLIDGIAFQTNILALNAAVEAARAGEQGRGFAVVASEVRSLAQRCAAAARDIGQLIAHSVEEITEGSQMAEEAGSRMGEIVGSVNDVAEIMRSIADSSREQSGEIDQISGAIAQMDAGTQQNAALAEEASAAARSLESEVGTLVDMIRTFRLPAQAAAGRPATRAA